jgi:hypothetical protein
MEKTGSLPRLRTMLMTGGPSSRFRLPTIPTGCGNRKWEARHPIKWETAIPQGCSMLYSESLMQQLSTF